MSTTKLNKCYVSVVGNVGKPIVDVKRWVEHAGGVYQTGVTSDTTHLIVSKDKWHAYAPPVIKALQEDDIHVVNYDWLHDTFRNKGGKRRQEKKYWWETLDPPTMIKYQVKVAAMNEKAIQAKNKKAAREAERDRKKAVKEKEKKEKAKTKISYTAALTEHTDAFMTPTERVAHAEAKDKKKAAASDSGSASPSAATSKASKTFRQGVKAATKDLFSENHHVYMDKTGFHYDVVLSKVDLTSNNNERHTLTIYESNAVPYTYTTYLKSTGTKGPAKGAVLSMIGSSYETAFRIFRRKFHELTTVDWDDRVKAFERVGRGSTGGSGSGRGGSNRSSFSVDAMRLARQSRATSQPKVAFEDMPFSYRLPAFGEPRGEMAPVPGQLDFNTPVQSIEQGVQQLTADDEEEEEEEEEEDEDERPRKGRRRAVAKNGQISGSSANTVHEEQFRQDAPVNADVVMQDGGDDVCQYSQLPTYNTYDLAMHNGGSSNNGVQGGPPGVYYNLDPAMQNGSNNAIQGGPSNVYYNI